MYKCQYCGKEFNNIYGLAGHTSHCKLNPNYNKEEREKQQKKAAIAANLAKINKAKEIEATRKERKLICKKCGKETYQKVKNEGRFQGWKSRNITSYAEKFWKQVLDNNNIQYIREYVLEYGNKGNGERYFLDFYIEINDRKIDLEIDGKQHLCEDRKEHDEIRDKYIKSKGIEVYRIPWNEINSENGKQLMKEKIDNFLKYINNIV